MSGDTLAKDFRYDGYTFTLANGAALDLLAYDYLSCEITTAGVNLEIARRNSNSFAPFYHRQVLGDAGEGEIGLVRIRNTSGVSITGTILTSSRRINWGGQVVVSGAVTATIAGVDIEGTNADAEAVKATGALSTESYAKGFNGTTWDRLRSGGTNNDAEAVETVGVQKVESYLMGFNGTTWDRIRGTATGGLYVQGKVASGSAHGTTQPLIVGGSDGTNARSLSVDTSGRQNNNIFLNGVAASAGSGTNGTGVQRVTIATDQAACTTAGLFSVKTDQTTHGTTDKVAADLYVGGIATPNGFGTSGTGVPRVTLASNNSGTALSSAASTNATSVKASAGQLATVVAYNQSAAVKYVKFYNKASAPTVGTDIPVFVLAVPVNGHVQFTPVHPLQFGTGIAFAITGGAAYTDTTACALNDVQLTLGWN